MDNHEISKKSFIVDKFYPTTKIMKTSQFNNYNDSSMSKSSQSVSNSSSRSVSTTMTMSLAQRILRQHDESEPFFSVEFFPPRSAKGAKNFIRLLDSYRDGCPLFCDVTWHALGQPETESLTSSITMAGAALNYCHLDTMLHFICVGMTRLEARRLLQRAKDIGIRSILALRGDLKENQQTRDFRYAADLVKFIREEFGNYFTICVAGYPIPHPESLDPIHDLECLKAKVDAGADFIITQLFFDVRDFIQFVCGCRAMGIKVPIIPGLCAINNYRSLLKFAQLSSVPVPARVLEVLEPIADNDVAVQNYGVEFVSELARQVLATGLTCGIHFYTLNQSNIVRVIKKLGLWRRMPLQRALPFKVSCNPHRSINETLRPVFWYNNPKTYLHRTASWTDFPMIFWSPNLTRKLKEHLTSSTQQSLLAESNDTQLQTSTTTTPMIIASPLSFIVEPNINIENFKQLLNDNVQSLNELFYRFFENCSHEHELDSPSTSTSAQNSPQNNNHHLQSSLPPPELPGLIQEPDKKSFDICFKLYGRFIRRGLLVLNYFPHYHDIDSRDAQYGWGVQPGRVFQKEYIEFLLEPGLLAKLLKTVTRMPYSIRYLINTPSSKYKNWFSIPENISWGVFNDHHFTPALVADIELFQVWNTEVFETLLRWLEAVSFDSPAGRMLDSVHSNYLHCALINTQYQSANDSFEQIFRALFGESTNGTSSTAASSNQVKSNA